MQNTIIYVNTCPLILHPYLIQIERAYSVLLGSILFDIFFQQSSSTFTAWQTMFT